MGSHSRWHSGNLNKGPAKGRTGVWGEWYREREIKSLHGNSKGHGRGMLGMTPEQGQVRRLC